MTYAARCQDVADVADVATHCLSIQGDLPVPCRGTASDVADFSFFFVNFPPFPGSGAIATRAFSDSLILAVYCPGYGAHASPVSIDPHGHMRVNFPDGLLMRRCSCLAYRATPPHCCRPIQARRTERFHFEKGT